ncbi:MAG: B12-binding domain-containing radical SAM protein [Cyanobacteriota bacterium]|nr:B12-binding domain-containing radical SAM protein [Cyanobacteriota bacterium]
MRVLLVYPRAPRTFWSFDGALSLMGRRVLLPPLGLITVASLLPPHWQLRLVDTQIRPVRDQEWAWAQLVILSGMIVHKRDLARLISLARAWRVPVAVGGPFATSTPEAPELAAADYLILDEGEITIPRFVAAVEAGMGRGCFRAAGEKPDLTTSPVPRFDLLDFNAYDTMAVQFSRGCPFQCEFCDIIVLYGRRPRTKTPDQLIAELADLLRLGWRGDVFLVDDNFIGNRHNVRRLLQELAAWQRRNGDPFTFTTEASLDLAADGPLMEAMVAARFRRVFLGIETPDSDSLVGARKLQNTRSPLLAAVDTITAHGLQVMAGFILGFDAERPGAGERIVAFITEAAIPVAMVGVLQALPNTALWQRLAREGRLLKGDAGFADGVQTHLLNFVPSRPMAEIAREFLQAFDRLYDPAAYLDRVARYCRRLPPPPPGGQRRPGQQLRRLRALLFLCWRQGVKRPTRLIFWRHLAALARRRPALLEDFLWMLALEEHFLAYRQEVREQVEAQLALLPAADGAARPAPADTARPSGAWAPLKEPVMVPLPSGDRPARPGDPARVPLREAPRIRSRDA